MSCMSPIGAFKRVGYQPPPPRCVHPVPWRARVHDVLAGKKVLGSTQLASKTQGRGSKCQAAGGTRGVVTVATRGSKLALEQAHQTIVLLQAVLGPDVPISTLEVKTRGDVSAALTLRDMGSGAFTEDVDATVARGDADLAVHSLKDAPAALPVGLVLAACLEREDVRDAFISMKGHRSLDELPAGSRVGTGSTRRRAQILRHHPDLVVVPLRGNVDARLAKLAAGEADATLLAVSGLKRLGKSEAISSLLEEDKMLPAACQGAIGVTCRESDTAIRRWLARICHFPTMLEVTCERSMILAILDGSKELPRFAIACRARAPGSPGQDPAEPCISFHGLIADVDGGRQHEVTQSLHLDPSEASTAMASLATCEADVASVLAARERLLVQADEFGRQCGNILKDQASGL